MTSVLPPHTGVSRTRVQRDHALITPESHVPILLPGWSNTESVVLISPEMGAKFSQLLVSCAEGATLKPLAAVEEVFVLVLDGEIEFKLLGVSWQLETDGFAFLPAGVDWSAASPGARLMVFSKPYIALAGAGEPNAFKGSLAKVPAEPFLGDEGALLQVLFPDDLAYDWGINVFDFAPGGTLPQVESHFMEHGLYVLDGQGVYRLGDHWYPVQQGDCIWMGPYLPQWYVAAGKTHSRYVYYKEMNRAPQYA